MFEFLKVGVFAFLLLMGANVQAEVIVVQESASYIMSDSETPSIAADRATQMARRQASEKVAVCVKSYTKVTASEVEMDEIEVVSVGLMKDRETPKISRVLTSDGQMKITSDIVVQIETDDIEQMLAKVQGDLQYKGKYLEVQNSYMQVQKELEELKKQLTIVHNEAEKRKLKEKLAVNEQQFTAVEWFEKGKDAYTMSEYERAIECFNEAIAKKPIFAEAYNGRGICYDSLKQYEKALEDYDCAIAMKSDDATFYINRGNCYLHLEQYGNAYTDYYKSITLKPKYADAYFGRAICRMKSKMYEDALEDYNKAITLRFNRPEVLYNGRAECYRMLGQFETAIIDCSKAISMKQDYVDAYVNRGICHLELKQFEDVLENCNRAIELKPDCDVAYYIRGYAFYTVKRKDLAGQDIQKCLDLTSNEKIRQSAIDLLKNLK